MDSIKIPALQFSFNDTRVSLLRALDDTRPYHQADI